MERLVLILLLGTGCTAQMDADEGEVDPEAEAMWTMIAEAGDAYDWWPEAAAIADVEILDEPVTMETALEEERIAVGEEMRAGGSGGGGGGDGVPGGVGAHDDPCEDPPAGHVIRGTSHADHLVGSPHRDIIFGAGGDDVIEGRGGNDIICAGSGQDVVYGGPGNDYIDLGLGKDIAYGGDDSDVIHGRASGDIIHGGRGADYVHGDILDDHLYGDAGADVIIGGHGVDRMYGGAGNDWMRGDTNRDELHGGSGEDTASFMTAMPPGQPIAGEPVEQDGIALRIGAGLASGDGTGEAIESIENVIGSPFDDRMWSGNPRVRLVGGYGHDLCNEAECEPGMEGPDGRTTALAFVDARPRDTGLIVLPAPGDAGDEWEIVVNGAAVHVVAVDGAPIAPGAGCTAVSGSEVACTFAAPLRYAMAWGGEGSDTIRVGNGFPRDFTSHIGGGPGDDILRGGDGQDVLFSGITGWDQLSGGAGDDALISESPRGATPRGEDYDGGGDILDAGPGDDQLVSDYPCGAHHFHGGAGEDIAGFARVGTEFATAEERHRMGIHAQLGGDSTHHSGFLGKAYMPYYCSQTFATRLDDELEILEGAGGDDELWGNDLDNFIWGWGGDDELHGNGGDDVVEGMKDDDRLFGDEGHDRLRGADGNDVLDARDGERDGDLSCGTGRDDRALTDGHDPRPMCR